jgi:hypothetical protein
VRRPTKSADPQCTSVRRTNKRLGRVHVSSDVDLSLSLYLCVCGAPRKCSAGLRSQSAAGRPIMQNHIYCAALCRPLCRPLCRRKPHLAPPRKQRRLRSRSLRPILWRQQAMRAPRSQRSRRSGTRGGFNFKMKLACSDDTTSFPLSVWHSARRSSAETTVGSAGYWPGAGG